MPGRGHRRGDGWHHAPDALASIRVLLLQQLHVSIRAIGPILALVLAAALLGAGVSSGLVGLVLVAAIIAVESFTLWRR